MKKCDICDEHFSHFNQVTHLKHHIRIIHEGKGHNCDFCEKTFSRIENLKAHLRTIYKDVYKCQ